jgi:hypothetical protein
LFLFDRKLDKIGEFSGKFPPFKGKKKRGGIFRMDEVPEDKMEKNYCLIKRGGNFHIIGNSFLSHYKNRGYLVCYEGLNKDEALEALQFYGDCDGLLRS